MVFGSKFSREWELRHGQWKPEKKEASRVTLSSSGSSQMVCLVSQCHLTWSLLDQSMPKSMESQLGIRSFTLNKNMFSFIFTKLLIGFFASVNFTNYKFCDLAISKEAVGGEGLALLYSLITNTKTIVTGAGDETPRFWNVFPSPKSQVHLPITQWLKVLLKD